jgi:hypothetical protein
MRAKVVCSKCAYLLVIKGLAPFCLAAAYFIDSELKHNVDVKGMKLTSVANRSKNCKRKTLFSLKAMKLHHWLKKDIKRKGFEYQGKDLSAYKYIMSTTEKHHGRSIPRVISGNRVPSIEEERSCGIGDNGAGIGDAGAVTGDAVF